MKNLSRFLHLRLQGCSSPDLPVFNDVKPDAPAPPDYAGAAQQQGQANIDAAIATGVLNRPNENTPFGSRTFDQTGSYDVGGRQVPIFTANTTFTPQGQELFNKDLALKTGMMDLGASALNNVQNTVGKPLDLSNGRDAIVDAMYQRKTRLLDPYYNQQSDNMRSDLASRGFSVGDAGYNRAQENFQRGKDTSYMDAMDQATTQGAQQRISELLTERNQPMQELNALRTGAMPQTPNFQNYAGAGQVQAQPDFAAAQAQTNAAMQQYGIDTGTYNNMMSGLFSIGAAAAGGPRK